MERSEWLALQNGSDIRGPAMGEGAVLTPCAAAGIGEAFGRLLVQKTGGAQPSVAVGHDPRESGPALAQAVADGLALAGCRPFLTGLSTTPSMYLACAAPEFRAQAAVMVTASHLPPDKNGFKFFTPEGGCGRQTVRAVLELAQERRPQGGRYECRPVVPDYARMLCALVRKQTGLRRPLSGLKILVDAGNGAGGFYAQDVLCELGADVSGSLFLEPAGCCAGHGQNPEKEENLAVLSRAVREQNAQLGIAFDPDADRAALIDAQGRCLSRNRLIALAAAVLAPQYPGGIVVTDSVTSSGLTQFLGKQGLVHHRFKRGYQNVIDEARRLSDAGFCVPLAIETSGHAALLENRFLDDGMYLATRLVAAMVQCRRRGEELAGLIEGLREPAQSAEYRIPLKKGADLPQEELLARLSGFVERHPALSPAPENHEGLRVNVAPQAGDGWFLLRQSLHDPVLVLNLESEHPDGVACMEKLLRPFFEEIAPFLEAQPPF